MSDKVKTMNLSGKEYAQVKDRLKVFREDNPRALIETTPTITDTHIIFKTRILKDKADVNSAEATGHSMGEINKTDRHGKAVEKVFEKQETISVGRALALLGYAGDGEIASSEEMEGFLDYVETQRFEAMEAATDKINLCISLDELKDVWTDLDGEMKKALEPVKETKKKELMAKEKPNEKTTTRTKKPRVAPVEEGKDNGVETQGHHSEAGNGA